MATPHFRGFPACPCLVEWLTEYEKEALRLGYIKYHLDIWQLIGGSPKSGGTHTKGGAADTAQISYDMIWLARQMGADAAWYRPYNWDKRKGMKHAHLVLRGCPHNTPARYQYTSTFSGVDHGKNGLANGGKDTGPRPLSKRTWKEGIAWAKARQAAALKPIPQPLLADDTTLTIAYWNVGPLPYSGLTAADKKRIQNIIAQLKAAKCSLAVLLELHEENGSRGSLGYFKEVMPKDWHVFEGDGGNHLVSMGGKYDLIKQENHISANRAFTLWNLRRKDTGLAFWVNGLHTTAGMKPQNILDRNRQAKDFVAQVQHIARGISCVDKNNASGNVPGSPTKLFKAAGITSMYEAGITVPGSEYNSHHDVDKKTGKRIKSGVHIDFLGLHAFVKLNWAKQIQTTIGGDHDILLANVTIKGTKPGL